MGRKFGYRWQSKARLIFLAISICYLAIACSIMTPSPQITNKSVPVATKELNIWWEQGWNLDEDEALRIIVRNWQQKTGNKVKLSFFNNSELTAKIERAVQAGNRPDIIMNPKGERILYPQLAWLGELEDVTEIIEPVKDAYAENILRAITYNNNQEHKRSYYGVPVYQSTVLIYYWQNLLASVGLNAQDIPQDWEGFWQFWQQAQNKIETQLNKKIFGLGLTLSGDESSDDTYNLFDQILEAYDLTLLDKGNLNITSLVRQGIINCLGWYAQLYRQGYIPPDAVQWSNTDNNLALLNRSVLMTPNNTLSIPATVRQDADTYNKQLGVLEFPHKPSGKPMRYLIFVRQAVIFKNSRYKSLAKDFLRYFIQPQVSLNYFKATGSRNQPVQTALWSNSYWQDTQDDHIAIATKILTTGQTRLSYIVDNPAYSQVLAENVWGKALTQVTANKISPEKAADEAISRIKEIFAEWES